MPSLTKSAGLADAFFHRSRRTSSLREIGSKRHEDCHACVFIPLFSYLAHLPLSPARTVFSRAFRSRQEPSSLPLPPLSSAICTRQYVPCSGSFGEDNDEGVVEKERWRQLTLPPGRIRAWLVWGNGGPRQTEILTDWIRPDLPRLWLRRPTPPHPPVEYRIKALPARLSIVYPPHDLTGRDRTTQRPTAGGGGQAKVLSAGELTRVTGASQAPGRSCGPRHALPPVRHRDAGR